jgi:glycosyltransferase involved in cell wall biosynthesis
VRTDRHSRGDGEPNNGEPTYGEPDNRDADNGDSVEVTVVLPCLNEAETLATCVHKATGGLRELGVRGEVVVSDNGSTDGSQAIAAGSGARVVDAPVRGYGGALMAGIGAAHGRYVIIADSDDSYDLSRLGPFVEKLREGHDVVMGNRFAGGIAAGAMPASHRYLGNPVLSWLGRRLFDLRTVGDFHCGIRGFARERVQALGLCMPGMEFASELVVRASLAGYSIAEVPTTLRRDGRSRPPHLRTWRDGWRHLRFMLMYSPAGTFLVPGLVLLGIGLVLIAMLYPGPIQLGYSTLDVHTMILGSLLTILGTQVITTGLFAKVYSYERHFDSADPVLKTLARHFNLERGLILGLLIFIAGFVLDLGVAIQWIRSGFGELQAMRPAILGGTLLAVGAQILFSSFFLSMLSVQVAELREDATVADAARKAS